jgi:hypothetical protein
MENQNIKSEIVERLYMCFPNELEDIINICNSMLPSDDETENLKGKYSFKVRNSSDVMKFELLEKAYNEMTLDQLFTKLK